MFRVYTAKPALTRASHTRGVRALLTLGSKSIASGNASQAKVRSSSRFQSWYAKNCRRDIQTQDLTQARLNSCIIFGRLRADHGQVGSNPLGRKTRYSLKCQSSWRALASTATPIIERPARRDGERQRGKIAFPELPNGIDDRRLANPTPCGIRWNKGPTLPVS